MADRCTGHCCRNFVLPCSPEEIEEYKTSPVPERRQIARMVVYLGPVTGDFSPPGAWRKNAVPTQGYQYGCTLLDPVTGDCTIYDDRPPMCRVYPSNHRGDACVHRGCTSSESIVIRHCKDVYTPYTTRAGYYKTTLLRTTYHAVRRAIIEELEDAKEATDEC